MDISTNISGADRAVLDAQVDAFNAVLKGDGQSSQRNLDKDDFLKILITQLQYQDPTKPMEDREFIAQMAQFSSLEQMTNLSRQFSDLAAALKSSQAVGLVGRQVEISAGNGETIQGTVQAVTGGVYPQVMVGGTYYDYGNVAKVLDKGE